jgi:hypothetical protein
MVVHLRNLLVGELFTTQELIPVRRYREPLGQVGNVTAYDVELGHKINNAHGADRRLVSDSHKEHLGSKE